MQDKLWITFLLVSTSITIGVSQQQCVFVDPWSNKPYNVGEIGCPNEAICNNTFIVSYITSMGAYYDYINYVEDMLKLCCGNCFRIKHGTNFTDHTKITSTAINSSHIVFPLLGKSDADTLYGYHFAPFIGVMGTIYVSRDEDGDRDIFSTVFVQLIPLLIISLLMAISAGFIVWAFERKSNKGDFPRSFLVGWFEGFWWAIVTMTTVGYGDKSPKSVAGKLFSTVWIFIGIITCAIITATLTNMITKADTLPPPKMKDRIVGMMQHHDYERYVIAKHGGISVEVAASNTEEMFLN